MRHRTTDTGHVKWFYCILSNAAVHSALHWTDNKRIRRRQSYVV